MGRVVERHGAQPRGAAPTGRDGARAPRGRLRAARALARRVRGGTEGVGDAGMATAEYAVATLAAVGFAGVLVVVLKGSEVKSLLTGIVRQALGG